MKNSKEIIKQVKKIEITTNRLVEELISGKYHSVFKGQGIDFSEIREYRPGDDIRTIDWNVTARFNKPFIKEFIEERNLRVYFAIDVSSSGNFGYSTAKNKRAVELASSLMFSALKNNDNIGMFLFSDKIEKFFPVRKGKKHIFKLISTAISYEPESKKTNLKKSLEYISKVIKRTSILFIISDFYSPDFYQPLKILKNKHDVIAIRVVDKRENQIPDVGLIQLEDEETGEQVLVDTSDPEFRKNFSKIMEEEYLNLKNKLNKLNIDLINIRTDEPYYIPLNKFFRKRKYRVNR